ASNAVFTAIEQIGDARIFLDVADGALRATPLRDDGTLGTSNRVLELPTSNHEYYVLHHARVGATWWVGAHQARSGGTTVRLSAVEPGTRAPLGPPVVIDWPNAQPSAMVDANGTPMVVGDLQPSGALVRPSFVPIDVRAHAACRPSTLAVASLRD